MPRRYQMTHRADAKQRTRTAILEAAFDRFRDRWFDEVTVADVARAAGVSQQTVLNHFGSKMGLYRAGLAEIVAPRIRAARGSARRGDVASVVDAVLADYEETGDGTVRTESLALREPGLADVVTGGRRWHRRWVEEMFEPQLEGSRGAERDRVVTLLALALTASTWHQLRRQEGLGHRQTRTHLLALVASVLASVEP